jgi:hypothetical protein
LSALENPSEKRKDASPKRKVTLMFINSVIDVNASLEPRLGMKKFFYTKRGSRQVPKIEGLSFQKSSEESSSADRKLSTEYAGTMKVYHKKLDETQEQRCDRFGTLIISGSKDHRV